jgi:CRISPR/Cas system endoribonuclease Cas6 (RAMP superfamily)
MDGVVGRLEAAGDLTELAPYFEAGVWLHVGSGTSMGMGMYSLEMEE